MGNGHLMAKVPASEVQEVKQLENCISGKASVTVSAVTS